MQFLESISSEVNKKGIWQAALSVDEPQCKKGMFNGAVRREES